MAAGKLPQTNNAQDIGERARICLTARRPQSSKGIFWRLISLEGTDDFGLDFQVHTVIHQQVTDTFRLQLKGTESPQTDAANTHLAIQFETSTLRLYARIPEPVLIVVCDLTAALDPVDCPLYYVWVHEELQRIGLEHLPSNQEKATVHVPKANRLTSTTDFGPHLQHHLEVLAAGRALDVGVAQARPTLGERERMELIQNVEKGLMDRSQSLLDALAEPADGLWVDPSARFHALAPARGAGGSAARKGGPCRYRIRGRRGVARSSIACRGGRLLIPARQDMGHPGRT